jgi:proteasome lid subunit RPN8/RPN11
MVDHAVRAFPAEAVGFLAGTKSSVEKALPLGNLAPQGAFLVHPYEQYFDERSMQSGAVEVLTIYHSHPDG